MIVAGGRGYRMGAVSSIMAILVLAGEDSVNLKVAVVMVLVRSV